LAKLALVIGGTGPTGPLVVDGLADRGYEVTILHGGQHEADFRTPGIRHIHSDPHFAETLQEGLSSESYDLVVAQYGRLSIIADVLAGRTDRLIAVGAATAVYAAEDDPRWGLLGRPALFSDTTSLFIASADDDKLKYKMLMALTNLMEHDAQGDYAATYLGYPNNYGPRQPGPQDWCIVRRILDGRRRIIIADGGLKLRSQVYTRNAAAALLRIVDSPAVSRGKRYSYCDEVTYTLKSRILAIAAYLGAELELIDMPYQNAWPCHPFWRFEQGHRLCQSSLIRSQLGLADEVDAEQGLRETVDWLLASRPTPGGESEKQIGDPFDYAAEDELIADYELNRKSMRPVASPLRGAAHIYRHPKRPNETWRAPAQS
jgi:nucleoside-diphosphate-sugar epimerase